MRIEAYTQVQNVYQTQKARPAQKANAHAGSVPVAALYRRDRNGF